ncbi:MAG TPA: choice-of-anchor D domain-containing protein, partial [Candidatus Kapabacteria bacterium]|nr:choice-of-anchor D domain-containing protein [Candidatus Kapabacteria bacterium]
CVRFNPLASGSRSAILNITSDGADSGAQQVNLSGIGIAPGISVPITEYLRKIKITVGDSFKFVVPLLSMGTGPLVINNVQLTGGAADQYVVNRYPTSPIPVGMWDSIHITYKPTYEGRHDASFVINSNALNSPQVTVRAYGIAIMPRLAITPLRLDFDSVFLGETACREVTLHNPGTDTVNILRVIRTFSDRDFSFTPLSSADTVILPEQTKVYRVCFSPTNIGTRLATVRFYSDIGLTIPEGADTSQFVLDIIGVGVPFGNLALSGSVIDSAVVGFENCVTDVIRNVGTAPVTITAATLTGVDAAEYRFSGLTFPLTINAGATYPITYCLTPTARGVRTASLVLTGSSEGQMTEATLPLNGIGLEVCVSSDKLTAFNGTMTPVGMSDTVTITITNCGDVATSYEIRPNWIVGPYIMYGAINTPVIAPGESTSFDVYFTPTEIGAASAAITVRGSGVGVTPLTIDLGGVGAGVTTSASGGSAGDVKVNECKDFTVAVRNDGNIDWTPGTPAFTGANAANFTFISMTPETIPAGANGTLTLRYCPTAIGSSTATVSFPSASPMPISNFAYNVSGNGTPAAGVNTITSAKGFVLGQNYPNPSAVTASFKVVVPTEASVSIDLFDQTGAFVRNIANQRMSGEQVISLDASTLASGTYNYVLTSEDVRLVRQLTVVR